MYFTTGCRYTVCSPTTMLARGTASSELTSRLGKRDEAYKGLRDDERRAAAIGALPAPRQPSQNKDDVRTGWGWVRHSNVAATGWLVRVTQTWSDALFRWMVARRQARRFLDEDGCGRERPRYHGGNGSPMARRERALSLINRRKSFGEVKGRCSWPM